MARDYRLFGLILRITIILITLHLPQYSLRRRNTADAVQEHLMIRALIISIVSFLGACRIPDIDVSATPFTMLHGLRLILIILLLQSATMLPRLIP